MPISQCYNCLIGLTLSACYMCNPFATLWQSLVYLLKTFIHNGFSRNRCIKVMARAILDRDLPGLTYSPKDAWSLISQRLRFSRIWWWCCWWVGSTLRVWWNHTMVDPNPEVFFTLLGSLGTMYGFTQTQLWMGGWHHHHHHHHLQF